MDGTVFSQSLWGSQQKEPFGVQRVFGRELQTSNSQPTPTGYQQVSGVSETGQTKDEIREGSAKELLGKCNQ